MKLADDDRARVPFALIGVLLVLGSTAYVATLADRPGPEPRPTETAVLERTDAAVDGAVQRGSERAATAAASEPVVEPAETEAGGVLDEEDPFEDYLRLRIYAEVRGELESSGVIIGDVRSEAALPPTSNASQLRAARDRVTLEEVDGGLRVEIENVTVEVRRNGVLVEEHERTVERTIASPVLAAHEQVRAYEERLNRGPTDGPGLGQRLTARMYAVGWARGYAQYGGAPIQSVVSNRHIELMTNGARLETQREVFGRSDPAGRQAMGPATRAVGLADVLEPTGMAVGGYQEEAAQTRPGVPATMPDSELPQPEEPPVDPNDTKTVSVGLTADRPFEQLFSDHRHDRTIYDAVRPVYTARAGLESSVEQVRDEQKPPTNPPGENWTLVDEQVDETSEVRSEPGATPSVEDGDHRLESFTRTVVVEHQAERIWARDDGEDSGAMEQTNVTWEDEFQVGIAVDAEPAPDSPAPRRGIDHAFERGGPLGGPNLEDAGEDAVESLVDDRGGPDQLALRAVNDDLDTDRIEFYGQRPEGLEDWLYADLATLRDGVREVSVTVQRDRIATGEVVPEARLASELHERRAELLDPPESYDATAEKARVASRAAYLDLIIEAVEARARDGTQTQSNLDDVIEDLGGDLDVLGETPSASDEVTEPPREPVTEGPLVGEPNATVSGSPPYLTLATVSPKEVPDLRDGERHYPLVARNVNFVTAPHSDVAGEITDHLFGDEGRVGLGTAGQTLQGANRTLEANFDSELETERDELQAETDESLTFVEDYVAERLARETELSEDQSRAAVEEGLDAWDTTATRAIAVDGGEAADEIGAAAQRRLDSSASDRERDWVDQQVRIGLANAAAKPDARPSQSIVEGSADATREVAETLVENAVEEGVSVASEAVEERWGDQYVSVPAGLPMAPVPGYWYATVNGWKVDVDGEYARFAVSVPDRVGEEPLTYQRDGSAVEFDVTGDGEPERLGEASRVSFTLTTYVVVVVPPGGSGVGDVDGVMFDESEGWPRPGEEFDPEDDSNEESDPEDESNEESDPEDESKTGLDDSGK